MRKVLLVNSNTEMAPYPVSPLGICMIATELKRHGYEVEIYDGLWENNIEYHAGIAKSLSKKIQSFQPDVIGLSVRNIDDMVLDNTKLYLDEIEHHCITPIRQYKKAVTVIGGPGFSIFPEELLKKWKFDYGIIGPGEQRLLMLLSSLKQGLHLDNIPGLLIRKSDNEIVGTKSFITDKIKASVRTPFSQIDTHLNYRPYKSRSSYPIQTKRGCALKCIYCSYPTIEGKSYRLRTAKEVVDEIENVLTRMLEVTFEFVDSTFNHPPKHAENICREIINRQLKVKLRTMGVTPAGVTPTLIGLMKKAGFVQIDCTPDAASDTMLKNLGKDFNRKKLIEVVQLLKDAEMPTMWFFILGGPGENEKTINETFEFIHNYIDERDLVHITEGLRIYPNTELENAAIKEGLIIKNESLLYPKFYISNQIGRKKLSAMVNEFTAMHFNCLRSADSNPSKEMIQKAMKMRKEMDLSDEPMFRTLLRIRKAEFDLHS